MTGNDHRSTRLDRAITGTGVGAATALAALLVMFGVWGLEGSAPRADNVGETGIALAMGFIGLATSLVASIPAGMILARRVDRGKGWLRALPLLVSVAWLAPAAIMVFSGAGGAIVEAAWRSSAFDGMWTFFVMSVHTAGAIPLGIGSFVAWIALVILRASTRQSTDVRDERHVLPESGQLP